MTELYVLDDDPEEPSAPAVLVLDMPPGYVLFRHAHVCHRVEVVVKGSLRSGDRTLHPGDVMVARPGEWYGPHVAGPGGCTTVEVFGTREGVFRVLAEADGGEREFDFLKGEVPPDYEPIV